MKSDDFFVIITSAKLKRKDYLYNVKMTLDSIGGDFIYKIRSLRASISENNFMINGMTLMLYVKNVNRATNFWTEIGFDAFAHIPLGNSESVVLSNDDFGNVTLQLYDVDYIRETSPEVLDNKPTILFSTDDIVEAHNVISKVTRRVGDIVAVEEGDYTFTFYDLDGNQFAVRGVKIGQELGPEAIASYFENLKNVKIVNARDIEFLPDKSFVFFGQVTDEASREFAEQLSDTKRDIYYVDTQTASLSSDLRLILKKYEINEIPAFIRKNSNGRFITYKSENESVDDFVKKL